MQQWKTILMRLLPAAVMGIAVIVARGIVPTVSAQQIAAGAVPVVFAIGLVLSAAFRRSRRLQLGWLVYRRACRRWLGSEGVGG